MSESQQVWPIVELCLRDDPNERPTFDDIYKRLNEISPNINENSMEVENPEGHSSLPLCEERGVQNTSESSSSYPNFIQTHQYV